MFCQLLCLCVAGVCLGFFPSVAGLDAWYQAGRAKHLWQTAEGSRGSFTRFPSSPLIRVPFFLLFGFNKGTETRKRVKGYYWRT